MQKIILHIDLDSFYASLEERRNPSLKGKPIAVCVFSGRTEDSGAVATANYPARQFGIHAGITISQAKQLGGDQVIYLPTDMDFYREVSDRIMEILRNYADKFEQRSVDEAYLDVSAKAETLEDAKQIAENIKIEILAEEGLTCSIGIGPNKLIAKMASKVKKPDGLTTIKPEEVNDFLSVQSVSKLFGIGPKTLEVLERYQINTIGDLAKFDVNILMKDFGENKGRELWERANGIDNNEVEEVERQQISKIGTLKENTRDLNIVYEKIDELAEDLKKKIEKENIKFKTIGIIAIATNLQSYTRSKTLESFSDDIEIVKKETKDLMKEFLEKEKDILRRCGIRVSNFEPKEKQQKSLFEFSKQTI